MMTRSAISILEDISALSSTFAEQLRETRDYWDPDEAPLTIIMSDLGRRFADTFSVVGNETGSRLLQQLEQDLADADEETATAIATGFVEGLAGRAVRIGNWAEIRPLLGSASLRHAEAWLSFGD